MNEKIEIFLEASSTVWDNVKKVEKPIACTIFVDAIGGVWNVRDLVAPCGGATECRSNAYRQYWFCEKHPEEGVLVLQYRNGLWCWLSGKVEVKR